MNFAPFAFQQQAVSAAAFNPNDLSDLTFWIDMSDSNFYTVTGGTVVTEIYSKVAGTTNTTLTRVNTSNGHYALAASLSNGALNTAKVTSRPTTYRSSTWNNGVATDATFGPKTSTTSYPDGSMFVVINRGTISSAGYIISRYNGSTDRGVQYDLDTGTPNTDIIGYDFNSPAYQYYNTTATANNILTRINNGATSTIYRNGVLQISGSKNDTQTLSTRQFHNLGIYGSPTGTGDSTPINTQYCEVIIYNRVLTESEINQVTTYLSNKWNISLPTPNIVIDSLSLNYNAGNKNSYVGTGTSWANLQSTVLTSTLTNGPTFLTNNGGVIVFDGTNDYTTGPDNAILDFGTGNWTLEFWVSIYNNSSPNNDGLRSATIMSAINKSGTINGWAFNVRGDLTNTGQALIFERQINSVGTYPRYTLPAPGGVQTYLNKNQVYQIGMSHSAAGGTKFFIDGVYYNADFNLTGNVNGTNALELGRLGITGYQLYLNGAIAIARIYNGKQLSAAELLQNYNADKGRFTPPNIVTTGLVLSYDAVTLAGGGTAWNNLQPTTLTSTLTNGPIFSSNNGGTVVFDGTNDYATGANNAMFDFGTGDFTIETWVKINGNSSANNSGTRDASIIACFPSSGAIPTAWGFQINGSASTTGTGLLFQKYGGGTQNITLSYTFTQGVFYQIGVSHRSGVTKFFINGTEYTGSGNLSGGVNSGGYPFYISTINYPGYLQLLNGTVGLVRVYKGTGLTASEILQNYNANSNRI